MQECEEKFEESRVAVPLKNGQGCLQTEHYSCDFAIVEIVFCGGIFGQEMLTFCLLCCYKLALFATKCFHGTFG